MPRVIAHRGARTSAPENTIEALVAAHELGAKFCEVDVMLSKDNVVFLNHDGTVDRCSDGNGAFEDKTAAELLSLDVGSWFSAKFEGTRYPLLSKSVSKCQELDLGLNIEIKHLRKKADDACPADSDTASKEREIARATVLVLQDMEVDLSSLVFSSFSTHALEIVQAEMPEVAPPPRNPALCVCLSGRLGPGDSINVGWVGQPQVSGVPFKHGSGLRGASQPS